MFGISNPIPGLEEGDVDTTVDDGASMLVITGKGGRVFWFYHEKLDKIYQHGAESYPRFNQTDVEAMAVKNAWRHCNETVTLGDLWKHRLSCTLVPLEEALFERWSWNRLATVGDNAHKMTPNHGQAGNNAVESAAALANELKRLADSGVVTADTIRVALGRWHQKRKVRIEATVKEAALICRMQTLDTLMARILLFYVMPNATELLLTLVTDTLIGAEYLDYLPLPARSFEGSCPYNQHQGVGYLESARRRAGMAIFILAPLLSVMVLKATSLWPRHTMSTGSAAPTMLETQLHLASVISQGVLVYAIWLLESNRRANTMKLSQVPACFVLLGSIFGQSIAVPAYFFQHYIFASVDRFAAADMRLTNIAYTKTILPLMLLGLSVSLALGAYVGGPEMFSTWPWVLLPLFLVSAVPRTMLALGLTNDTMHQDSLTDQGRDLPYIRWCVVILTGLSAATWMVDWSSSIARHIFQGANLSVAWGFLPSTAQYSVYGAGIAWLLLLCHDLKSAGMLDLSWARILVTAVLMSTLAGPLSSVALGWLWREQIIYSRRERHAMTREKFMAQEEKK